MSNTTLACTIDWATIGAVISALATTALALIAWKQLGNLNKTYVQISKTSKADFAHRCNTDFFSAGTRELFMLFDYDMIKFHVIDEIDFAYFEIDKTKLDSHPILYNFINKDKQIFSAYEIDDLLLGPLDNVGTYFNQGLINIDLIVNFFGYYIEELHNNKQIEAYLEWIRSEPGYENIYDSFEAIYRELIDRIKK
jgi:hypothetical protein